MITTLVPKSPLPEFQAETRKTLQMSFYCC